MGTKIDTGEVKEAAKRYHECAALIAAQAKKLAASHCNEHNAGRAYTEQGDRVHASFEHLASLVRSWSEAGEHLATKVCDSAAAIERTDREGSAK